MKPIPAALLLAMLMPFATAHAQEQRRESAAPATTAANPAPSTRSAKAPPQAHLYRSSKIIGTTLRDAREKKIGNIKDLVLDRERGEIAYAVVSFGGVLGVGRKLHAIPWQALEPSDNGRHYILHADRETISQAPGFDMARWPDMADPAWSGEIDRYWTRMVGRGPLSGNKLTSGAPAPGSGAPSSGLGTGPRSDMQSSGR
ncbi:PRC-barrel domain-containing protein [Noviherbaspirillum sp. CPCC 100848]|uniref:PRC-barrel domain-containing protein n=1 Tax=Noviherbaspirillum album TaxID=3080276 RepID=A0ABU6J7C9_9BURK|nr:PRC-barrel domain-containing protein [Noviherbaspirillum sp. CPCC 100848]MEC4719540.1 PRC-barrel domain-containing protein [Noviherbaspirillum sp. CPCC 100848]